MPPNDARMRSLLAYCRIEEPEPEERSTLDMLYDSAVGYLAEAGILEPDAVSPRRAQYDMCINYLVLDGFDRRELTFAGGQIAENPAFRRLINQLKLTEGI